MKLNITLKGIESLMPETEGKIKRKLSKVEKHFNNIQDAMVVVGKQRGQYTVEVTLYVAGRTLRAEGKGTLVDIALNDASKKLDKQVRRYKERLGSLRKSAKAAEETVVEGTLPHVVKVKTFPMKPMSVDEAILQLEMLDHDFFVFKDADTARLKVVYKRKDGNYGLIETKV